MKPEIARGVRRLVPRRRRARGRPDSTDGPVTTAAVWPPGAIKDPYLAFESAAQGGADVAADRDAFDPAEFAAFLEADDAPMPANPAFKERLRQQLWGMLRENADATAPPAPPRIGDRPRRPPPSPNPKPPR